MMRFAYSTPATLQQPNRGIPLRLYFLLFVLLAGFAIRLYNLGGQSLWYDETVSAFLAGSPVNELLAHTARDIHPPGYYLLLHFWLKLAGQTEFALAFFSLLFGVLLVALVYRLAHHLAGRAAAAWAALLVAISPYQAWYSQEVRMYTLAAVLGLAAVYCAVRALAGPRQERFWWGYALAAAAGLYTLYYLAFLLLALNLLLLGYLLLYRHRQLILQLLLANGLALLVYLPWLPIAWRQATLPPVPPWREAGGLSAGPALLESWTALSLGQSVDPVMVWPWLLLMLLLYGLGWYALRRAGRGLAAPLLVLYTFGPLLLIYLASFITPLYHVRYVFSYAPAFYVLVAAGLAWLGSRRSWLAWTAAGLVLAGSVYSLARFHAEPAYRADDFRAAVNFIEDNWQPGDAILINAGYAYTAYQYYTKTTGVERQRLVPYAAPASPDRPLLLLAGSVNGSPQLGWGDPQADFYAMSAADTTRALAALSQDYYRLWLLRVYDTVTDPDFLIRAWLAENTALLEDQPFAGPSNIRVQAFLLPKAPDLAAEPVLFEDGLLLAGWRVPERAWPPGQVVPVKLWWAAAALPSADYKMSLKLWRPDGELMAQGEDTWPAGSLYRATDWPLDQPVYQPVSLPLPANLPPGQYWLNVELYHPDTVRPLPLLSGEAAFTLGPVTVGKQ